VIDKLDIVADPEVPLTKGVESEYSRARKIPDKTYKGKAYVRLLGKSAVLLRYCRYNATHKLCIVGVSRMTIQDVAALVLLVFDCDPWELRLARVDFAVDLNDVAMDWIRAHARVPHKHWKDERGFAKQTNGVDQGSGLYIGSRNDLFRFYDKGAELAGQSASTEHELQSSRAGRTLTRIERQLRTGRIPTPISTLRKLAANARVFNPFAPLSFAIGGKVEPRFEDYSTRQALEGTGFRAWVVQYGFAKAWEMLNVSSRGNAGRIVRRLGDFIPADPEGLRVPDLFAMHRAGLGFQLGESI
jgi:hypothetical protein